MFQKILIANRGEIAVRIIRACREMGIKTVAVYSEADRDALHTLLADEAICIGPAPSTESYLDMERILTACVVMKADAIHPGFGFLSENARFAELCEKCNIRFIGPSAEIINKMGNKSEARKTMMAAGVPVVPGSKEPVYTVEEGLKTAKEVGFPVMIKASSGGGGKEKDEHYFEVCMIGVPKDSGLLEESDVWGYLSETAPVDFNSQQFSQAQKIRDHFEEQGCSITCYKILRGSRKLPIYKPYSRTLSTGKQTKTKNKDYVRDLQRGQHIPHYLPSVPQE